ncbi:hypothetical protein KVR01_001364 [Diaporthe batatas]|uniref:uncharacterized protein n=1 Tax=Diaporthe batatas TaxID=748121 RepID=UPI001D04E870|nr:uncharacterized protein KVR01_001364 [Diaporthe batatas]KAG8168615.1 hypothetical protein KVR01_001364 [Diaporthe batatas]
MKLLLVAAALSAVSYAQIDMAKVTDCSALSNECRSGPGANQAQCSSNKMQCEQCQTDYQQCRSPGNGVSGNQAGCAAQVAACVGSAFPGLSLAETSSSSSSSAVSSSSSASASATAASNDCQTTYKACVAGGKSEELCGCDLATCTGEDNARTADYCAAVSASASGGAPAPTSTAAAGTDDCQGAWRKCVAGGRSEELCSCDLAVCTGEDEPSTRERCASLSAGLDAATATATADAASGMATSAVASPTAAAGGEGGNSTSSTPVVTGAAASVGFSVFGAASAFVSYLLI